MAKPEAVTFAGETEPDIIVTNHGSLMLFVPGNEAAGAWLKENVQSDATWWGESLVVEPRYARDLAEGAREAGWVIE